MSNKGKILWITRTAGLVALLIAVQAVTASWGNIIVTGSLVNMILVVSVMIFGLAPGLSVAVISPVLAKFLGIGPFWSLVPFVAAGNLAFAALWYFMKDRGRGGKYTVHATPLVVAALVKFFILYLGIVQITVPLLGLPARQATVISTMFSIPQLVTALIGGIIAGAMLPTLKAALST